MSSLRRVTWMIPVTLAALALTVVAAVLVARHDRSSALQSLVAHEIANANPNAPPEIVALNAQLAQVTALHKGANYGTGLTKVVRGPVASLRPVLGEEWRELGRALGHLRLDPTGQPSAYLEVGTVVVAQHGPARLAIHTSDGQSEVRPVGRGAFDVVNFGPLRLPAQKPVALTLSSLQPRGNAPGPSLILSPLQAQYRAPGQWLTEMSALAEVGPGGAKGLYLANGSTTRFAMAPGVKGRCSVVIRGAAVGASLRVAITVGGQVRSARLDDSYSATTVGPFSRCQPVLSATVGASASSTASLFVSDIRLLARRGRGK